MAAVLNHEAWDAAAIYATEAEALEALLAETADYRAEYDEPVTDDEWLEVCFSEGWTLLEAEVRGKLARPFAEWTMSAE